MVDVMTNLVAFAEFIRRIRAGDDQAAAEFVRQYEPLIRRAVRFSLEDDRLRRVFDSMDVSQSVLASFFARAAVGMYDLENPQQLVKLLATMTRNKVATAAQRQRCQRRDNRRTTGLEELENVAANVPTPSERLTGQELLAQIRASLSDEEATIAGLRREGLSWADIAARLGGAAQARRMQLARAVQRISRQMRLE
jgi:RNA polymerase sigma-70 factor (ECF subfamily)